MFYALLMAVEYLNLTTQQPQESQPTQRAPIPGRASINTPQPTCPQSIKCVCVCCHIISACVCVSVCVHAKMANGLLSTHATATPIYPAATPLLPSNNQAATGNNLKDTNRNRKRSLKEPEPELEQRRPVPVDPVPGPAHV